jgi:hypothetical protein
MISKTSLNTEDLEKIRKAQRDFKVVEGGKKLNGGGNYKPSRFKVEKYMDLILDMGIGEWLLPKSGVAVVFGDSLTFKSFNLWTWPFI